MTVIRDRTVLMRKTVGYLITVVGVLGFIAVVWLWYQVKDDSCRHPDALRDGARDPLKLISIARTCVRNGRLGAANNAWVTARLYAVYDMHRIDDRSAHAIYGVMPLILASGLPKDRVELLAQAPKHIDKAAFCQRWATLPPPQYEPTYMLHHGMAAFTGRPLKAKKIDDTAVWAKVLSQQLKSYCPSEFLPGAT